ncbi:mitochondrial fission ELM1 family protein [Desulfomarina sp.]
MNPSGEVQIHVVCFLDGRPGHEKQSRGILRALREKANVQVTEIPVPRLSVPGTIPALYRIFFSGTGFIGDTILKPALVMGTGSGTHPHVLLFKRRYKVPAITCMAPDLIYRKCFDLCFVPAHDGLKDGGNIVTTLGPPNCSVDRGKHNSRHGLILLGGIDEKSHKWDCTEIITCLEKILEKENSMKWVISSSPRTPVDTVKMVENLAAVHSCLSFFRFEDTPQGWIERQYDLASIAWVTADSVSMIHEALTAGCKVGVLPVQWKKKNNKFKKSIAFLEDKGFVLSFEGWAGKKEEWSVHEKFNEAQRCADIILQRWWPRNLR